MARRTRNNPALTYDASDFDRLSSAAGVALMPWHTALGNLANTPAKKLQLGDSLTEGYNATSIRKRWASLEADALQQRWNPTQTARGGHYRPAYWHGTLAGNSSIPAPATLVSGTSATDSSFGFGGRCAQFNANGRGLIYTENCTSFDICYVSGPATGTIGVTVDGGTEITFTTAASLAGGKRWNSSTNGGLTLSAGSHTIQVRQVGATSCYFSGLMLYLGNETSGIQVVEAGHFGWKASDWITSNTYRLQEVGVFQPHLISIMLGANDWQAGVASSTFAANLQTLITQLRGVLTATTSFQIIACHERGDSVTSTEPWQAYVAAMRAVAASDTGGIGGASGVVFTDLSRRLPKPGSTGAGDPLSLIASDRVHYADKAGGLLSNAIMAGAAPR